MELINVNSLIIGETYYLKSNRSDEKKEWIRLKCIFVSNTPTASGIRTTFSPLTKMDGSPYNSLVTFPKIPISCRFVFTYHDYRPSAYIYRKTDILKNIMAFVLSSILDTTTAKMISDEYL